MQQHRACIVISSIILCALVCISHGFSPHQKLSLAQTTTTSPTPTRFSRQQEHTNAASIFVTRNNAHRINQRSVTSRLSTATSKSDADTAGDRNGTLTQEQMEFTMGYLNKHHSDLLRDFALIFTRLGGEQRKRNSFSGGTYEIKDAKIVGMSEKTITLDANVHIRNKDPFLERVDVLLDSNPLEGLSRKYKASPKVPPPPDTVTIFNDVIRRLNRLCLIANYPSVTGKLIQVGIQLGSKDAATDSDSIVGKLPENMYLNQVPHNRYVRKYFYDLASDAVMDAVTLCSQGVIPNRMELLCMFPELNPSMDSYRIGTLLELTRDVTIKLAEQNLRVRICVQGSMGEGIFTGVPKQLSGVKTLLARMDWQSEKGEINEGMVGNYVNFGEIGSDHVVNAHTAEDGSEVEQDDVFILICPQSMIGVDSSIIGRLQEMVQAAGDRPVILINPDLTDKVSPQGQQSVRGRQERIDFANSFKPIFHFQNIYVSGTSYFPILGAICKFGPRDCWIAHQRRDFANDGGEVYIPVIGAEIKPDGELIMSSFNP